IPVRDPIVKVVIRPLFDGGETEIRRLVLVPVVVHRVEPLELFGGGQVYEARGKASDALAKLWVNVRPKLATAPAPWLFSQFLSQVPMFCAKGMRNASTTRRFTTR